eukprot:gene6575-9398_t
MSTTEMLKAARDKVTAADEAAAKGRSDRAQNLYTAASEHFSHCARSSDDEASSALFMEMTASCSELAKLQEKISSLSGRDVQFTTDIDEGEAPQAVDELKRLEAKISLMEQEKTLLYNQQKLLLDLAFRLSNSKDFFQSRTDELRRLLFDEVTSGDGTLPVEQASSQPLSSSSRRIGRLRNLFTQQTNDKESLRDLAASLILSNFVSEKELAELRQDSERLHTCCSNYKDETRSTANTRQHNEMDTSCYQLSESVQHTPK